MKSIICSFLATSLCLFPFVVFSSTSFNNPILLPTDDNPPDVVDIDGQPVIVGKEYIIRASGTPSVFLETIGNTRCPNAVVEDTLGKYSSVIFFNKQLQGVLREKDDINIAFSASTTATCVNETVWKVDRSFVVTGGFQDFKNLFKIEKVKTEEPCSYKFVYCSNHVDCKDVGKIFYSNEDRRLDISYPPALYCFKAVDNAHA